MANKWLEALKAKKATHNTMTTLREAPTGVSLVGGEIENTCENGTDKTDKNVAVSILGTPAPSKNGSAPEKSTDKITQKTKKRTKRKQLTPEEEEADRVQLEKDFPEYVYTEERAREVLEWARQVPEVAIDIETYGRLKRDGLLYARCQVRMILLHYAPTSFFLDCNHVPEATIVAILDALKDKPKYLHNALFDIPRLYRRFGVLLDQGIQDTMIASRVARAGEWERKKGRAVQKSHSLDDCLKRELGLEIPKDTRLKWGGP